MACFGLTEPSPARDAGASRGQPPSARGRRERLRGRALGGNGQPASRWSRPATRWSWSKSWSAERDRHGLHHPLEGDGEVDHEEEEQALREDRARRSRGSRGSRRSSCPRSARRLRREAERVPAHRERDRRGDGRPPPLHRALPLRPREGERRAVHRPPPPRQQEELPGREPGGPAPTTRVSTGSSTRRTPRSSMSPGSGVRTRRSGWRTSTPPRRSPSARTERRRATCTSPRPSDRR